MSLQALTTELLAYLAIDAKHQDMEGISGMVSALCQVVTPEDVEALYQWFLKHPQQTAAGYLTGFLCHFAQQDWGPELASLFLEGNHLKDPDLDFALELIGHTQYEPALPALMHYVTTDTSDHYRTRSAVLGLLVMDCSGYEEAILASIEDTLGRSLFPEFVPALVCKLPAPESLLARLFESGSTITSTDCNAGMVLGFAHCGELGRRYFKAVMFDPAWEADDTGTGTARWVYEGMKVQHIGLRQLLAWVEEEPVAERQEQGFLVWMQLVKLWFEDPMPNPLESSTELHSFIHQEKKAALHELADQYGLKERVSLFWEELK